MPSGNLTNGHSNGTTANGKLDIPVTKLFAAFVANSTPGQLNTTIREKVKEVVIDYIGVVVGAIDNADSSEPIYKAVLALQGQGNTGQCTVLAKGKPHMLPQYAGRGARFMSRDRTTEAGRVKESNTRKL